MHEADLDTIPLADVGPAEQQVARGLGRPAQVQPRASARRTSRLARWVAPALIVILCVGSRRGNLVRPGRARGGMTNGWPLWRDDHPLYYHSALVTRAFLRDSWTTAGYDPFFMSGYAKSVVFPSSSTLPELVVALFGGDHPELAYKLYVLVSAGSRPLADRRWPAHSGGFRPAERRSRPALRDLHMD